MKNLVKRLLRAVGLLDFVRRIRQRYSAAPAPSDGLAAAAVNRGMRLDVTPSYLAIVNGRREIRLSPGHRVYADDMLKFFDYYHGAVVPREEDGRAISDYSKPALHRLAHSGVEFEFPALPESDESTREYLDALHLSSGDVVLDLGAYAGASAYFLAQRVGPKGRVISLEPDETSYRFLTANIARHRLANVVTVPKGVWSATTTLEFQSEGNMGSSVVSAMKRDTNARLVPVVTLEDAAAFAGDRRVAAIKMDIEGAEVPVLKSAAAFLRKHRPAIVVEPHLVDGRMTTEEVSEILRANDYETRIVSQGSQNWPLVVGLPKKSGA